MAYKKTVLLDAKALEKIANKKIPLPVVSNLVDNVALSLLSLLKTKNAWLSVGFSAFYGFLADGVAKEEKFWKDSLILILQKKIKGVQVTIEENTKSDYPKAYRTIKRV